MKLMPNMIRGELVRPGTLRTLVFTINDVTSSAMPTVQNSRLDPIAELRFFCKSAACDPIYIYAICYLCCYFPYVHLGLPSSISSHYYIRLQEKYIVTLDTTSGRE